MPRNPEDAQELVVAEYLHKRIHEVYFSATSGRKHEDCLSLSASQQSGTHFAVSHMLKSSGALGAATLTSRIFGLVREIVYARFMGDTWVASAFIMAFTIPNLFRRLLGEGALTAAFIPVFKEKEKLEGTEEMWKAANAVLSGLVLVTSIVVIAAVIIISGMLKLGVS